jgi:hypothetical protein
MSSLNLLLYHSLCKGKGAASYDFRNSGVMREGEIFSSLLDPLTAKGIYKVSQGYEYSGKQRLRTIIQQLFFVVGKLFFFLFLFLATSMPLVQGTRAEFW